MEKVHLSINGLTNSQSKNDLKNALNKIDGVQKVNVDFHRGSIEVGFNDSTSETEIKSCILNTGFKVM